MTEAKLTAEDIKQVTVTFHTATGETFTREVPRLAARSLIATCMKDGHWHHGKDETVFYQIVKVEVNAAI